jgi:hypothetical protein
MHPDLILYTVSSSGKDRVNEVRIDSLAELEKISRSPGMPGLRKDSIQDVFRAYRHLKDTRYFTSVFGQFGNREVIYWRLSYTCDVFDAYVWEGRIFFIIEVSGEAIDAFLDDGFSVLKIKDWLVESYRKAVSDMRQQPRANKIKIWDYAFNRYGSPLPEDVLVLPFFDELAPGAPTATLALVKPR